MRKNLLVFAFLILLSAQCAFAQLIQARFVSSAYGWQQQDTVGQSSNHLFGYQTVQLNAAMERFSFHTYWQGYNDFAGEMKGKGQYRLYNLYVRASNLFDLVDINVGRQPVFAGVGMGTIDGALAAVKLFDSHEESKRMISNLLGDKDLVIRSIKILVRSGSPAAEIVKAAKEMDADLIVMSTHGRTGLRHTVVGSVAEKVVRYALCPVLSVKPEEFRELVSLTEEEIAGDLHMV